MEDLVDETGTDDSRFFPSAWGSQVWPGTGNPSPLIAWHFRVCALVWVFRRKLRTVVHRRWGTVLGGCMGDSGPSDHMCCPMASLPRGRRRCFTQSRSYNSEFRRLSTTDVGNVTQGQEAMTLESSTGVLAYLTIPSQPCPLPFWPIYLLTEEHVQQRAPPGHAQLTTGRRDLLKAFCC